MRDDGLVDSSAGSIETFLSTHPDPVDRISNIDQMLMEDGLQIRNYKSTGEGIFKDEYIVNIRNKIGN